MTIPPEVAVTVSGNVPAGVPGVPPPPVGGGADPPPPQEAQSPAKSTIIANPDVAIRMTDATGRVARNPLLRFRGFSVASRPSIASSPKPGTHGNQGRPDGGPGGGPSIERAVVETVTVAVASFDPSRFTVVGAIEQVALGGAPPQLSDTLPVNPLTDESVSPYVADCPAEMVLEVGEAESEKTATEPELRLKTSVPLSSKNPVTMKK